MTLILGIDAGTGGARAVLVDAEAPRGTGVVGRGSCAWRYERDDAHMPVLPTAVVWDGVVKAAREAMAGRSGVTAIGVCSQRTGVVMIDEDGATIYAGPNADPRGLVHGAEMEAEHGERIYRITGRLPAFLYLPARLAWLRSHRPDDAARVTAALSYADWIAWRMTGVAATEPTQAAESLCYDVGLGRYSEEIAHALGVPVSILPPLHATDSLLAETAADALGVAAGVPVVRAGGDTPCAATAAGVLDEGAAHVPAGTTMPVGAVSRSAAADPERRVWLSPHPVPGRFLIEAHCGEAGAAVEWALDLVGAGGDYEWLDGAIATTQPGAGGVGFVDTGPVPMGAYPMVRLGGYLFPIPVMALGRPREDFARATLEAVAFAARSALEMLAALAGAPATRVALTGGLSRSDGFARILATVLEAEIERTREPQASALGAAIAAAAPGFGSLEDAARAMAAPADLVAPEEGWTGAYPSLYPEWLALRERHEETRMRIADLKG